MSKIKYQAFPGTSHSERMKAIEDCWKDGYKTGFECPDRWEEGYRKHGGPGGPFVYSDRRDPEYSTQSRRENEAWCNGWRAGNKEKHARRADMARGFDDRGGIGECSLR